VGLIAKQREKLNYTQPNLARICGVSLRTATFWDANDCVPKTKDAVAVSATLGIPIERLAGGKPFANRDK
jgi:DNA-binding XRE family transcriptional regulator